MIIKKLNTQELINLLKRVKKEGFEFLDIEGVVTPYQDTIKIFTRNEYRVSKKETIVTSEILNDDVINALLN